MIIRQCMIERILSGPEFPELIEEYARESAIDGMPAPKVKFDQYRTYEEMGVLHSFIAEQAGAMVGFITVIAPVLPHYSMPVAVAESFFVAAAHRKGGAGLKLLEMAEERARLLGSPGLLVCTPVEGRLSEVLPRRGYRPTNVVFFKRLLDS